MRAWETVAAGLLVLVPGTLSVQQSRTFDWKGQIQSGKTLEVRGINGQIRATLARGSTATVHATLHGKKDDPSQVKVDVIQHEGSVTVCAVYPTGTGERENVCRPGGGGHLGSNHNDVQVDFEIGVPSGVRLVSSTVNGEVSADGLQGPVDASTVNGSVSVSTTGTAEAHSVNGSVEAKLGSIAGARSLSFETVNGAITVTLPPGAAMNVEAETTNGEISSEFPLTVVGRFGPRHASGTIGGGGPELKMSTVNGGISLEKGS